MAKIISHRLFGDIFISVALFLSILSLMLFPSQSVEAARSGLELCGSIIIPSLFPFFVLSDLMMELGLVDYLGKALERLMKPLFNVGGSCSAALALGFIGGYPVGAATAISLYKKGHCSRSEAERLLAFCNNSGPAFILGVVGAGIFSSSAIGLTLYLAHVASSLIAGMLFRFYRGHSGSTPRLKSGTETHDRPSFPEAFTGSVKAAFQSTLNICGFVIFFTVMIKLLFLTGVMGLASRLLAVLLAPLGIDYAWAQKLLTGIIEMSSGVWSLSDAAGTLSGRMSMAAFILGWAGVSVHCQVLSFIGGSGLSTRTYILGKALHGIISAGLIWFLARLLPLEAPVAQYLAEQVQGMTTLNFASALTISTVTALAIWFMVLALSGYIIAKGYGNSEKSGV